MQSLPRENLLYRLLEVSPSATDTEIKAAWRKIAKECHPDRQPAELSPAQRELADLRYRAASTAWEVLGDPEKRAAYDERQRAQRTDRIAEVAEKLDAEVIVNLQGDEPQFAPEDVDTLAKLLTGNRNAMMATLATLLVIPAIFALLTAVYIGGALHPAH